jgi:hypothetical protein
MTTMNKREAQPESPGATWLRIEGGIINQQVTNLITSGKNIFDIFSPAFICSLFKAVGQAHTAHVANYGSLKAAHATGPEVAHGPAENRPSTPREKPILPRPSLG